MSEPEAFAGAQFLCNDVFGTHLFNDIVSSV